jgi:hypothetical protein
MTEDEKKKLKAEIFGDEDIPQEFEVAYRLAQIREHIEEVNKIKANFLMFAETNDDEGMKKCSPAMKLMRDRISFFEKRLIELKTVKVAKQAS